MKSDYAIIKLKPSCWSVRNANCFNLLRHSENCKMLLDFCMKNTDLAEKFKFTRSDFMELISNKISLVYWLTLPLSLKNFHNQLHGAIKKTIIFARLKIIIRFKCIRSFRFLSQVVLEIKNIDRFCMNARPFEGYLKSQGDGISWKEGFLKQHYRINLLSYRILLLRWGRHDGSHLSTYQFVLAGFSWIFLIL